ncbi:type II toxin-antitoxin system RelE/ParE family toxin [Pseudactinotalea sp.]|uniref:type II toxin-antitoxin system RelE/ParE family toxin n=1 Tax=Pseudactinotalea sp. TaxID=1926260 RepID=UPI003B3AF6E9
MRSFRNKGTERIWHGQYVKRVDRTVKRATLWKLELIHAAKDVEDLRIPPGNRLERLVGDGRGQHSIRVNAQWRLCFVWREGGADDVELVDYHRGRPDRTDLPGRDPHGGLHRRLRDHAEQARRVDRGAAAADQ